MPKMSSGHPINSFKEYGSLNNMFDSLIKGVTGFLPGNTEWFAVLYAMQKLNFKSLPSSHRPLLTARIAAEASVGLRTVAPHKESESKYMTNFSLLRLGGTLRTPPPL
ncbi:hypothetical protein J6590_072104 [Homalodisca vitripennis]|nr:hypothetical protein J6590_072104 [Homalodisca vitripennis]